jgi:hypothetical protein
MEIEQQQRTWQNFARLVKTSIILTVIILILLTWTLL